MPMREFFQSVGRGFRAVLSDPVSVALTIACWLVFMAALIAFPAARVVGNDVLFQLQVFRLQDWLVLGTLSLLAAYAIAQSVFLLRFRLCHKKHAAAGAAAGVGAMGGAIVALITCPACWLGLVGFLSAGTLTLLSAWRGPIVAAMGALAFAVVVAGARQAGRREVCDLPDEVARGAP